MRTKKNCDYREWEWDVSDIELMAPIQVLQINERNVDDIK